MAQRQSVNDFNEFLFGLIQQLNKGTQQRFMQNQIQGAQQRAFSPPVGVGGTPVDFNRRVTPPNAVLGTRQAPSMSENLAPLQPDYQMQGGGGQGEFLRSLLMMATQGNTQAKDALGLQSAFRPQLQSFGPDQTVGEIDPFTNQFTPKFQTGSRQVPDRNYAPTELAKHQAELDAIRKANPQDPRIPEYEAVIKKLQIGVPNFQIRPGAEGEYMKWDAKTGQWVPDGGQKRYQPTPSQIRLAASQLTNVGQSAKKLKEIVGRASVTGPVTGRARKLGARFFSDKDAQELVSTIGQLRPIIYGLSGKQINEAEQEWLDNEILPKLSQPDENFDVTLDIFSNWVNQTLGNMKSQFPSLQIDVPGSNNPNPKATHRFNPATGKIEEIK